MTTDHTPSGLPQPQTVAEAVAKAIYQQWESQPGYKPWVEGGNSLMQDKARDIARAALAPLPVAPKAEPTDDDPHWTPDHAKGTGGIMGLFATPQADSAQPATKGIPTEVGIAWQSGNTWPNERKAVTVDGHAWYRHDHPSVRPLPVAPKAEQAATQAEAMPEELTTEDIRAIRNAFPVGPGYTTSIIRKAFEWGKETARSLAAPTAPTGAQPDWEEAMLAAHPQGAADRSAEAKKP